MNAALLTGALLNWSAQVFIVVTAAGLAALAIAHPKARLVFWQTLLLALLALPLIEPWRAEPIPAAGVDVSQVILRTAIAPASSRLVWRREDWLLLIAAGAALRLAFIAAGFLRLRAYRRSARVLDSPPFRFAAAVSWYASESASGPVTYGWLQPSILLPARVLELPSALREAIACHELVHVRRRDWLFVLGEELLRSVLWFHPAVWYALSRIQLAREQVVDREVVRLTGNREGYLDALLAVAAHKFQPDLAPAPLFLKKRHLNVRVASMLKEVSMSRTRIAAGLAAVCSAAMLAALAAMWLFPFTSPAQTVMDAPGITVDAGATLLHRAGVRRPDGVQAAGTVVLEATLNNKGEVTDARVLSGPDELRRPALESVLQWHYQPGPARAQVSIQFQAVAQAAGGGIGGGIGGGRGAGIGGGRGAGIGAGVRAVPPVPADAPANAVVHRVPALPLPATAGWSATVRSIEFTGVSAEAQQQLRDRLSVREGDSISQQDIDRLRSAIREFDNHMGLVFTLFQGSNGNREAALVVGALPPAVLGGVRGGRGGALAVAPPPPPPPPPPAPGDLSSSNPMRVSGNIASANLVNKVTPVYPPLAKAARIQGAVILNALIGKDGAIKDLQVVSGHPLLVDAAMAAVGQWTYRPTLLNGEPAEVLTQITVNFTLAE